MTIVAFEPRFEEEVVELIVTIQRDEFGIEITADQQPDLRSIPSFYQTGAGNFWVAAELDRVVGTISLLDLGAGQGALRKMFVHPDARGAARGTADRLLATLLEWAQSREMKEIFLGTTPFFRAAHRFYEKNGFHLIETTDLPQSFPIMEVDHRFYKRLIS